MVSDLPVSIYTYKGKHVYNTFKLPLLGRRFTTSPVRSERKSSDSRLQCASYEYHLISCACVPYIHCVPMLCTLNPAHVPPHILFSVHRTSRGSALLPVQPIEYQYYRTHAVQRTLYALWLYETHRSPL